MPTKKARDAEPFQICFQPELELVCDAEANFVGLEVLIDIQAAKLNVLIAIVGVAIFEANDQVVGCGIVNAGACSPAGKRLAFGEAADTVNAAAVLMLPNATPPAR